jgi:hypothetical protein
MKFIIALTLISLTIACKKREVSQIGIEISNPREGLVINFNGSTNLLYFVKAAFSSTKPLKQIEYKIINKSNNATVSSFLEDDLNNITDTNIEISEYMPSGVVSLNVALTCTATDTEGFSQSKTVNYTLIR